MNRKIENPFLYVEVSDRGAELMRIMRKDTRCGDSLEWGSGFLDCFRVSNYFSIWQYLAEKNEDKRKGISDPSAWICQRKRIHLCGRGTEKLRYRLMSDEETRKYYPFDFVLWITYELERRGSRQLGSGKPIRGSHEF